MDNTVKEVEILLVEDNPTDAELAMRALKKCNLANKLMWVKDGAEDQTTPPAALGKMPDRRRESSGE
jgi:two-component system response regulator